MKYYTFKWWADEEDADHAIAGSYPAYLERIVPELPPDLQRLAKKCCLHDAALTRLELSIPDGKLVLELLGDHYDESLPSSYARRFRLTYLGVSSFTSTADPHRTLGGPGGYGDLGYDELEVTSPGCFEHRMLFSTSIEFAIRFSGFVLDYSDFEYGPPAQPGASPNGGPAERFDNSGVGGGPPSVNSPLR
jgi:hypothetical protein